MNARVKIRNQFVAVVFLAIFCGVFAYPQSIKFFPWGYEKLDALKINLGLDLQGGIHLEYKADVSEIPSEKVTAALQAAEAVIERRVNAFGVGEPLVDEVDARALSVNRRVVVHLVRTASALAPSELSPDVAEAP